MPGKKKSTQPAIPTIQEEAGLPSNWEPINSAPIDPNNPGNAGTPPSPSGRDPFQTGALPQNFGLDTDLAKTMYGGGTPEVRIMPIQGGPGDNAKTIGVAQTIVNQAIAAIPVVAPIKQITDGITHGQNNVTKGTWESDPGYVLLRDDFHANLTGVPNGSGISVGLGQLGWSLLGGSNAVDNGFFGGGGLHTGMLMWENSAAVSGVGLLSLAPLNTTVATPQHSPGTWALGENPGSVTTFVFKTDTDPVGSSPAAFSTADKALYVGYTGTSFFELNQTGFSRPDVFIGVRFDTSATIGPLTVASVATGTGAYTGTYPNGGANAYAGFTFTIAGFISHPANNGTFLCTASTTTLLTLANPNSVSESSAATATRPGLNDAFFTLEAVANPTYTTFGRNNTQGATLVTNVAPTVGGWHRLDIFFSATGFVTLTLDGSASNSLTTAIPTISIVGSTTGQVSNDKGLVSWTASTTLPYSPWNDASVVTISGFTSGRSVLNGTATLTASLASRFTFNLITGNVGGSSDTVTLSGYPSLTPIMMFGNDDTGTGTGFTPTAGTMAFYIDYFSFVQNSNLGPSAPGTPSATLPRYF